MRLSFTLLLTGLASIGLTAMADDLIPIEGIARGMSPDAKAVVGNRGTWGDVAFTSFLYDVDKDLHEWITEGTDCAEGLLMDGMFNAINNQGMIAGAIHNPALRLPYVDPGDFYRPGMQVPALNKAPEQKGEAITTAAVWRDGKRFILDIGSYTVDEFEWSDDGSQAIAISPDGNMVFGNIWKSFMAVDAYVWEYNAEKESYESFALPRPESAKMATVVATSEAGFPAIGNCSLPYDWGSDTDGGYMTPIIWTSAEDYLIVSLPKDEEATGDYVNAISADGKYVVLSQNGTHPKMWLFNLENEDLEEIELPANTFSAGGVAVSNDGNIILSLTNSTNFGKSLYYFERSFNIMVLLSEYLTDASGFDFTGDLAAANIIALSGDGKQLLFQENGGSNSSLLLTMDDPKLRICAAPSEVDIYYTEPGKVEIAFKGISTVPDGCELTGYEVTFDGMPYETVEATDLGGEYTLSAEATLGNAHMAQVRTLFTKNGESKISGPSQMAQTYVSRDMSLIGVTDFDDAGQDAMGNLVWMHDTWQARLNYGAVGQFINWHLDANDFENRTPAAYCVSVSLDPWSCVYESHFMDASEADDFFLDFRYQFRPINSDDQDFTTDWLDVEYTLDGRTWNKLTRINAAELPYGLWQSCHLELGKELAGKIFRLRFNANGIGHGQMQWAIDDICIDEEFIGDTPTGLRYSANEEAARITWHNAFGMHDLSYLDNSSILWDYNVEQEDGLPLIGAIELAPELTKPFEGEYITAVSTFLYDDPNIEQPAPTTAHAIVYVDGQEVTRVRFNSDFNTVDEAIAVLPEPIKIEPGKNYRIGVRISEYTKGQAPMYYQASSTTVPGRSDLFSEDDGKTWDWASDFVIDDNTNPKGLCVWPIRAHISAEPVKDAEHNGAFYYDVFLDGKKINTGNMYEPHSWVTVPYPYMGTYTVQAHYKGGYVSPMSEPLAVDFVNAVKQVEFTLNVVGGKGCLTIEGDFNRALLFDMDGRMVANTSAANISGLKSGIYILSAETDNGNEIYKVNVK